MSGHSKWHNIRLRKGRVDALRGALFTRLSKEIILAAKAGSAEPEANSRLKLAIEKAREHNMPLDNIKRAIARATGAEGGRDIEEIRYEGYGPAGVAVIVDAATDNRNRTAAELRFLFSRHDGSLGESGSVAWMFDPRGVIEVDTGARTEDQLTESVLIDGVIDVRYGPTSEIITEPAALAAVRDALVARGVRITGAILGMEPKTILVPNADQLRPIVGLLDALEEHEDVQRVYANVEFAQAELEALA